MVRQTDVDVLTAWGGILHGPIYWELLEKLQCKVSDNKVVFEVLKTQPGKFKF